MPSPKFKISVFENSYALTNDLIQYWISMAHQAVEDRGRFLVALSGGTTPIEFYSKLAGIQEFDLWPKTHIFLVDERFVPTDHKDSNFRIIKQNLLDFIPIPQTNIHPIPTHVENVAVAAEEYKHNLVHFFNLKSSGMPRFDFMLLGIGEDGHTASLFPSRDTALSREEYNADPLRLTLPVSADYLDHDRVTLSLSVINNAQNIFFFVRGKEKASIVKRILEDKEDLPVPSGNLPASRVAPIDGQLTYLLDREAAQLLTQRDFLTQDLPMTPLNF